MDSPIRNELLVKEYAALKSGDGFPASLLDRVYTFLRRFIVYPSEHDAISHTLWVAHTHLMDVWESTPRIAFLSPEPASGKTRALEITETLVPRPVQAINTSASFLFRRVSNPEGLPTILYDEVDTIFGQRVSEKHEEVRAIINAGHRRGGKAGRCITGGKRIRTEELDAYCAVAVAGIGNLPDTILSRSLIIAMHRRTPHEPIEPYRRRLHAPEGNLLREMLARWTSEVKASLTTFPAMPECIADRNADIWEPLLTIADAAGGDWPDRARVAGVTTVTASSRMGESLGVRLLGDIKEAFNGRAALPTSELLEALHAMEESPWGDIKGKPLSNLGLSNLLRPYKVTSISIRVKDKTCKGYKAESFFEPWLRYVENGGKNTLSLSSQEAVTPDTLDTTKGDE